MLQFNEACNCGEQMLSHIGNGHRDLNLDFQISDTKILPKARTAA